MHPRPTELHPLRAMADAGVKLSLINLSEGWVAFENGAVLPITEMRDRDGDVTVDPSECAVIDFGTEEAGFGETLVVPEAVNLRN
jgi:hypothetical protein